MPADWDYAPAPESRDIVSLRGALRPLRRRRVGRAALGRVVHDDLAARRGAARARSRRRAPRTSTLAVAAAREAFGAWSALPGAERAKYLFRIARILQERSREFAVLESLNGGKPIKESRDVDLPLAAAHFFYYAGWADKLEYAFPNRSPRPLGVAGQIIPWNFPLLMLAWKLAPALAAGNTVVLKPAETTPLTALLFCDVLRQAELPPGVVNIVTGDGRTGAALVDAEVDKIAFTGSTEVGKAIQRRLAGTGKKLTLELGGKAANIVFDDAALDQAVEGIVNGIYFNQGHVCCAGSRLFVQESIAEPAVEKLKQRMATLRVGDPLDKNTDVGAINSRAQLEKIEELVAVGHAPRAPRSTSRRAGCPRRATGSRRPCSRTSRRATGSRRRRSSARCSRCSRSARPRRRSRRRTTRRTACPPASGRRRARGSSGWPSGCAPASSGRTRSTASTRGARSAATRSPASGARAAGTGSSRTSPSTERWLRSGPATAADEEALAAIDRATWSSLSSPAPPPGEGWTFFDERTRPEDVLVAVVDGEVAGYVRLAPASPLESTRPRAAGQRDRRRPGAAAARQWGGR